MFQKNQSAITLVLITAYFLVNGFINSTTVVMEYMRSDQMSVEMWEPFTWEFSSAIGSLLLVIVLTKWLQLYPWHWQRPALSIGQYSLMALAFSAAHIAFMILSRELVYALMGREYEFAVGYEQWRFELIYELRKDIWSFVFFVIAIWGYRYIVAQWLGDAKEIGEDIPNEQQQTGKSSDLLLIKKLGREFLVDKNKIEWIEASGNYLNLYVGEDVFPMRATFKSFLAANAHLTFKRVHRSYAINLNFVDNLTLAKSGDGVIQLSSGKTVKMSRRYKLALD